LECGAKRRFHFSSTMSNFLQPSSSMPVVMCMTFTSRFDIYRFALESAA
jgi:hypothetical protein